MFSPVTAEMEQRAGEILAEEVPGVRLSLSHEIGRIGLLERENATVMNACLVDLAFAVVSSFRRALRELQIEAPFFISQNDGTLMAPHHVERYPVLTFASGPTNSMRGAALLAGLKEAMVVDIGGTTSDVGMLMRGFPREAAVSVDIGGVRTNFRMPDVLAIGLGGGSLVRDDGARIGPNSVGYELTSKALAFGGDILTTTDIVVAAGLADIGEPSRVKHLSKSLIKTALDTIHAMADAAVDRMKTSAEPMPVILVGGGAILVSRGLPSASEVVRPVSRHGRQRDRRGRRPGRRRGRSRVRGRGPNPRSGAGHRQAGGDRSRRRRRRGRVDGQDSRCRGRAARLSPRQRHPHPRQGGRRSLDAMKSASVMPAKAGIQTWPHVLRLWIPAFAGMTACRTAI